MNFGSLLVVVSALQSCEPHFFTTLWECKRATSFRKGSWLEIIMPFDDDDDDDDDHLNSCFQQ